MEDAAVQAAKALFEKHQGIHVADALLEDLMYLYAAGLQSEDDADALAERLAEDDYRAVMRQIFCRACMAVNGALQVQDEAVFQAFVARLELADLSSGDAVLEGMLRFTLRKLGEDAVDGCADETRLQARMEYVVRQV